MIAAITETNIMDFQICKETTIVNIIHDEDM